jgi:hypothetical protein
MKLSSISILPAILAAGVAATLAACSSGPEDTPGSLESAATAAEVAQARSVLSLLGGTSGTCNQCHGAAPETIRTWGKSMQALQTECLAPTLTKTAAQRIDCLRGTSNASFDATRLGLLSAGANTAEFAALFNSAFGRAAAPARLAKFVAEAGMPRGGQGLNETQWKSVKTWVLAGMPGFAEATGQGADAGADTGVRADSGVVGGACVDKIDPALTAHVKTMAKEGWAARHREQSIVMFGCGAASKATDCLTSLPDATARYGTSKVAQTIRELRAVPFISHYWVRSSVDGRYMGFGLNSTSGSRVIDLRQPATAAPIVVAAKYDPVFFPSNDGFSFAGALSDDAIHVCRMSVLADAGRMAAPQVLLNESKCATLTRNVYQSIGSALDGSRYFVSMGLHENDDGGNVIRAPLPAAYGTISRTQFIPMANNGVTFVAQAPIVVNLPNEGDVIQSASSRAFATRISDGVSKQVGYGIHLLQASGTGAALTLQTPTVAKLCGKGGKPEFSMDERFIAYHDYVAPGEGLPVGSSNIVLVDLLTGQKKRITENKAGVYALFPQFRADGWMYFLIRDINTGKETMVASDVALR